MYNTPQKLVAEFIGTFAVVLFSAGAYCARIASPGTLGVIGVAMAYGFVFGAMAAAMTPISGGHLNPAITIGYWVTRRIGTFHALSYTIAQLAGSVAASYLLRYAIPEGIWRGAALGTPDLSAGFTRTPAMLMEGLLAFILVWVFFAANGSQRAVILGFSVTAGSVLALPFTGGSMNPARAFGPALAARHWTNHGVYWVGPLAGGAFAAWLYDSLFRRSSSLDEE